METMTALSDTVIELREGLERVIRLVERGILTDEEFVAGVRELAEIARTDLGD